MGYTHYFQMSKQPTESQWGRIVVAAKQLEAALPEKTRTAGGYHANDPLSLCPEETDISLIEIRFNGGNGLDHETFLIHPHYREFNFCKTARKPYDLMVTAVLLACHHFAPGCWDIGSDGDPEDWQEAVALVRSVLQIPGELPPGVLNPE